ncbi:hypothetical protein [Polymorphospora lycopeni]|uniref:Phage tail protein n=1 Tax=Polymorphospora lycopeni TaxID=3140240 RepID=A0ABV5CKW3_9ACTN
MWPLDVPERGWFTPNQVSGLGAAPIGIVSDPHPRGGVRVRHIQPQARVINWPLVIRGTTADGFQALWRSLARAFTQTRRRGPGRLQIARPDGSVREIRAYYQAGWDGEPGRGWIDDTVVISLLCEDPYWRSTAPVRIRYEHGSPVSYLEPVHLTVSPASVLGTTTAVNSGDVEAWPEWTITGPASAITATNVSSGESFTLDPNWDGDGDLLSGQTVTITTDPPAVRGPAGDGDIWTGALNWPGAVLWGLQPGTSNIQFAVSGSAAGTSIELAFDLRFETP